MSTLKFAPGDMIQHRTGTIYRVLGACLLESTLQAHYIYEGATGDRWVRPVEETEDGRFTLLSASSNDNEIMLLGRDILKAAHDLVRINNDVRKLGLAVDLLLIVVHLIELLSKEKIKVQLLVGNGEGEEV